MSDDLTNSEKLLMKWAGDDIDIDNLVPTSRFDEICLSKINGTPYEREPLSRMEALLLRLPSSGGGGDEPIGTIQINQNGTHNVKRYASAEVNVPQGTFPEGSLTITENGTYDVTEKASAVVNVQGGSVEPFINDASHLFYYSARLSNLSQFEDLLSNTVRTFNSMFQSAAGLTDEMINSFKFKKNLYSGNITMRSMFNGCTGLQQVNLIKLDTNNVTNMSYMFLNCNKLISVNVSSFDTSKVTDMDSMFNTCSKLTELDLSNFDLSSAINIGSMFRGCSALTKIKLGTALSDYSKITTSSYLFYDCSILDTVIINGTNVLPLKASNCLTGVPSTCKFYVPDALVSSYKSATNWAVRGDYIFPLSQYVEE